MTSGARPGAPSHACAVHPGSINRRAIGGPAVVADGRPRIFALRDLILSGCQAALLQRRPSSLLPGGAMRTIAPRRGRLSKQTRISNRRRVPGDGPSLWCGCRIRCVRTVVGAAQRWDLIRHFSHDTLFSGEASDSQPTGISFSIVRSQIPRNRVRRE